MIILQQVVGIQYEVDKVLTSLGGISFPGDHTGWYLAKRDQYVRGNCKNSFPRCGSQLSPKYKTDDAFLFNRSS